MKTSLKAIITSVFILLHCTAFAQDEKPSTPIRDRLFFGGNLGLQFGSSTYIDVSPLIGYQITEKFQAGVGLTYIYYKTKNPYYGNYETSIYGGRVFSRYYFLENVFGHAECEILNMDAPNEMNTELVRRNVMSVMAGGGYAQPIGQNAAILLMVLYNFTEDQYSPYTNPIFRVGITAGF
jgi:hypothetical protein